MKTLIMALGIFATLALGIRMLHAEESAIKKSIGPFTYDIKGPASKILPDISLIGSFAAAAYTVDPVGSTGHDPTRSGFTFQGAELSLQSVVDNYFKADVFIAFHEDEVELEEAYFTTLSLPKGLQIKGGKFLQPIGRQNQKHIETWDFADNMLINKYLLDAEGLNEMGLEVSYLLPTPFFLNIQTAFTNGANEASFNSSSNKDFLYLGRLSTSFDPTDNVSFLLGTTLAYGNNDTAPGNATTLVGGDILFKWKPKQYRGLTWQSEFMYRNKEEVGSTSKDGGFYSYIDYQFVKRWHAGLRFDYVGIPDDSLTKEYRLTPALTFNPTEFTRLRAQYKYDKSSGGDGIHVGILQFEFSMGPHGAHAY